MKILSGSFAALLLSLAVPVEAQRIYQHESLLSLNSSINIFVNNYALNNSGTAAFIAASVIYGGANGFSLVIHRGSSIKVIDMDPIVNGCCQRLAFNDNEWVALVASEGIYLGDPNAGATGAWQQVASINSDGVSGDFKEVAGISLNDSGVIAAYVRFNADGWGIVRITTTGWTTIDSQNPSIRFNFTSPTINDTGVIAWKAQEPAPDAVSIFITDGIAPISKALALPTDGNAGTPPDNNNAEFVAGANFSSVAVGKDGVLTELIVDGSDSEFVTGPLWVALNEAGDVMFDATISAGNGIFYGPDPVNNRLIAAGDPLFGGVVHGGLYKVRFPGPGGLSDTGHVLYLAETRDASGSQFSHLVRARYVEDNTYDLSTGFESDNDFTSGTNPFMNTPFSFFHSNSGANETQDSTLVLANSNLTNPGNFTVSSANASWQDDADDGVFLGTNVSGDFFTELTLDSLEEREGHGVGLMIRAPLAGDLDLAGPGQDYIQLGFINDSVTLNRLSTDDGISSSISDPVLTSVAAPQFVDPETPAAIRIRRHGSSFFFYTKPASSEVWLEIPEFQLNRPDLVGIDLEVGIYQTSTNEATALVGNFSVRSNELFQDGFE